MRSFYLYTLLLATMIGGYFTYLELNNNFHEVLKGELYRSAQPSAEQIISYKEMQGIRTIINLRGAHPGKAWYDNEIKSAEAAGINHLDFAMTSDKELSPTQASMLIEMMRQAPKPLLIHCAAGTNRTGLASALYIAFISKKNLKAELQLSPVYGYFPFWFNQQYAMLRTFEKQIIGKAYYKNSQLYSHSTNERNL